MITSNTVTKFSYDDNDQIKSVTLSNGIDIETDMVIICTAYSDQFPIMKIYGKSTIDYNYKPIEIKSIIDHETGLVITFDDVSQRYCQGAIINPQIQDYSPNTHFRAVTPDGLPVLDQDQKHKNLYYNLGHGFLGWTWSFVTAKLIDDLIFNEEQAKNDPLLKKLKGSRFW